MDRRGQWCLKSREFDNDFKAKVKDAARVRGMGMSQWVAHTLREGFTRDLGLGGAVDIGTTLTQLLQRMDELGRREPPRPPADEVPETELSLGRIAHAITARPVQRKPELGDAVARAKIEGARLMLRMLEGGGEERADDLARLLERLR